MGACDSCFNWGSGSVGARALSSNACANKLTGTALKANCKFYDGTNNGSTAAFNCMKCNKKWNNKSAASSTYTQSCSDTAANTTTCNATISDCDNNVCYTADGTTYAKGCFMCSKGKAGSGTCSSNYGCTACAGTAITNCDYHYYKGSANSCYSCKSGYAVASTTLTCSTYTTDSNCRQLNSSGACHQCWHSYYWNTTTCKLTAFVTMLSGAGLAILAMLF